MSSWLRPNEMTQRLLKIVLSIWTWIRALPRWILLVLDWLVSVAERLVVLGVVCAIFYIGRLWVSGAMPISKLGITAPTISTSPAAEILKAISENWKALLLLLIPLFYRTIKGFIERMEEGPFGTKAPLAQVAATRPTKSPNQPQEGEE